MEDDVNLRCTNNTIIGRYAIIIYMQMLYYVVCNINLFARANSERIAQRDVVTLGKISSG